MKACKQCGVEKKINDFYPHRKKCKECKIKEIIKYKSSKEFTPERSILLRIRNNVKKLRDKNHSIIKKSAITMERYNILKNDVFENKSFLNLISSKEEKPVMLWYAHLDKDFDMRNIFLCTKSEYKFIQTQAKGDTRIALDLLCAGKSDIEKDQILGRLKEYDEKKKKFGLIKDKK